MLLNPIKYNFLGEETNFDEADVVVVPIAYSSTSSFLSSKEGAKEIIEASREIENFDIKLKIPKFFTLDFLEQVVEPEKMQKSIFVTIDEILKRKKFPLIIGGEHSIAIASFKASYQATKSFPIVFDAHADFREEFEGSKFSHACTCKRIKEISNKILVVGVRSLAKEELKEKSNIIFAEDLRKNFKEKVEEIKKRIEEKNVYISFDFDFLDPSFLPSVSNPEPFGFSLEEAMEIIKEIAKEKKVIAIDFCEFSPTLKQYGYVAAKFILNVVSFIVEENKNKE
ncbi:MAG: agmatinase [Candidatus Micrarchaeia archaeon]